MEPTEHGGDPGRTEAAGLPEVRGEPPLDRPARLATRLLQVPAAWVSLLRDGRWATAGAAGPAGWAAVPRTGLAQALCERVAADGAPVVAADARSDERLTGARSGGRPAGVRSGGPEVAACAGFPLRAGDGRVHGVLCVADHRPRQWSPAQLEAAGDLARTAEDELELWSARQELPRLRAILEQTPDAAASVSGRRRAETLREVQHAVAGVLADAASAEQAATGVVAAVTEKMGWTCGEYWRADDDEATVTRVCTWVRPGRDLSVFLDGRPDTFGAGQDLAGAAWSGDRDVWIEDLAGDLRGFARERAALRAGLRSAIGLPVRSGRRTLGVLTFFADTVQEARDDLVSVLDGIGAHLGRYKERRRAEELELALAASRRHFDEIVAQLDDDVWTTEIGSDGVLHSVYASPNVAKLLGGPVPAGTDKAEAVRERVHPEDREIIAAFNETISRGRPMEVEYRLIGLDGVTRWIWMRGMPRREGDRLFVDGISTDVTERHRIEEERERLLAREREQVRRLRELDRMKDELVALVSHELRAPIGAVRGYVEMLLDDPDLGEEQRAFAGVIDRKSAHLQRLVDDLLDLARLDAGHMGIDPRPVSLTRLVRQSVEDLRPAAEAGRLAVEVDLDRHLGVHADPVRLRQVLDNLLSNAVKYTPEGGRVTVTARHEEDAGEEGGRDGIVVVTVADTGIGIPAEQYPQLFTRFFRASTAQEAGIEGTGLGLPITKAIVDAHGGEISVAPREGGGTVFTVRLPVNPPPAWEVSPSRS
ncbi:hypothetical protein GCM10010466_34910 [Planomonospora alba]|uniref:histidine kinase n=1 Tax=Planomonospora alba TaxID=161354 RepID=A0ABP6N9I5_9ACTN